MKNKIFTITEIKNSTLLDLEFLANSSPSFIGFCVKKKILSLCPWISWNLGIQIEDTDLKNNCFRLSFNCHCFSVSNWALCVSNISLLEFSLIWCSIGNRYLHCVHGSNGSDVSRRTTLQKLSLICVLIFSTLYLLKFPDSCAKETWYRYVFRDEHNF